MQGASSSDSVSNVRQTEAIICSDTWLDTCVVTDKHLVYFGLEDKDLGYKLGDVASLVNYFNSGAQLN